MKVFMQILDCCDIIDCMGNVISSIEGFEGNGCKEFKGQTEI